MNWVDFILNIAGLLLWLNWRAAKGDPLGKRTPATLVGTLRRAEPIRMRWWHLPIVLGAFLFLRAILYWLIGPCIGWASGILNLGIITPSFRSDHFLSMLQFSFLSFLLALGIFYSWLLLLSLLKGPRPVQDFVRVQLGRIDGWSSAVKLALPLVVTVIAWWLVTWMLVWQHIIPPISEARRLGESFIVALQSYLTWEFPLAALLALYLLNSYIYFGHHPIWNYVDAAGRKLLRPLKKIPLRLGKADFTPVAGIALVFLIAELAGRGLRILYARLSY